MKSSTIAAAAAFAGAASAAAVNSRSGNYGSKAPQYGSITASCPFFPSPDQFVIFPDNIQYVSFQNPDTAFSRSSDFFVETPYDISTAWSFTTPDFAYGAQCSLIITIPSFNQDFADLRESIASGGNNLTFSYLEDNLPSADLTYNTLGDAYEFANYNVYPGKPLTLAQGPCPPPGVTIRGVTDSYDAIFTFTESLVGDCPFGLYLLAEPLDNPPVSPYPTYYSGYSGPYGYPTTTTSYSAGYTSPPASTYTTSAWAS